MQHHPRRTYPASTRASARNPQLSPHTKNANDDAAATPKSAARAAAEAAFAPPPIQLHAQPAVPVFVRRARDVLKSAELQAEPHATPDEENLPQPRVARVFRISPATPQPGAQGQVPDEPARTDFETLKLLAPAHAGAAKPRRLLPSDRRPGPVMHTVNVYPPPARPEPAQPLMSVRRLATALASVEPVLELIERAQRFQVMDPRFAAVWHRLGQTTLRIQADIEKVLQPKSGDKSRRRR